MHRRTYDFTMEGVDQEFSKRGPGQGGLGTEVAQ